jgi:hypothetical protein
MEDETENSDDDEEFVARRRATDEEKALGMPIPAFTAEYSKAST